LFAFSLRSLKKVFVFNQAIFYGVAKTTKCVLVTGESKVVNVGDSFVLCQCLHIQTLPEQQKRVSSLSLLEFLLQITDQVCCILG
jgi:serine/threonine protein phosphatase PrpC